MNIITTIDELQQYVEVVDNDLQSFTPSIRAAERRHLVPVLGDEMYQRLHQIYDKPVKTDIEVVVLGLSQEAVANIAMGMAVTRLAVQISGAGVRRAESADKKSAYQYQETNVRDALAQAGFDALEDLLAELEVNKTAFPEWADSAAFKEYKSFFIGSGLEFSKYYEIKQSRLAYMSIRFLMRSIENWDVRDITGKGLFDALKAGVIADNLSEDYTALLNDYIRPGIALLTIGKALLQRLIQVNEHGVTISLLSNDRNTQVRESPDMAKVKEMAASITADGNEYLKRLAEELGANPDKYPDFVPNVEPATHMNITNKQENGIYGV